MKHLLEQLNIIDGSSVAEIFPRTRDVENLPVYRCQKSGVIFLEEKKENPQHYYQNKSNTLEGSYRTIASPLGERKILRNSDAGRRAKQFKNEIAGKVWLDFGTGNGEIIDLLNKDCKKALAVEPNKIHREAMQARGIAVYEDMSSIPLNSMEVITLFHVFEHLTDPIEILKQLYDRLTAGGTLIIEVPHANDFLLKTMDLEAFKQFTFWSEHLILHTRESLHTMVQTQPFHTIHLEGFQRYGLSNHLYWLRYHQPGGHAHWAHLETPALHEAYQAMLCQIDQTDTLIAVAKKE